MNFSKREMLDAPLLAALGLGIGSRAFALISDASTPGYVPDRARGRLEPTVQSLKDYQTPEWFRDAKFGIWAHWGPQAVPRQGDWYARWMYVPGHPHYEHHLTISTSGIRSTTAGTPPRWAAARHSPLESREVRKQVAITSQAKSNPYERRAVRGVRLLGHRGKIEFRQTGQALVIDLPATLPTRHGSAFAIEFA